MAGLASYYASAGPYMQFKMGQDIMSGESQAMERAMSLRNSMLQQQASEMKIKEHLGSLAAIKESLGTERQTIAGTKTSPLNDVPTEDRDTPFDILRPTSRQETDPELYNRMGTSLMMHPQAGLEGIKTGMGLRQHAETLKKENDKHTLDVFKTVGELAKKVGPRNFPQFYRGMQEKFPDELKDVPAESWNIGEEGDVKYLDLTAQGYPDDMVVEVNGKLVHVKKTKDIKETWGPEVAGPGGTTRQVSSHGAIKEVYKPFKETEDPVDKFTRTQAAKDESESRKRYITAIRDYNREVSQLTGQYNASMRGGVPMTTDDWNSQLKTIEAKYAPAFADRPEGAKWGEPKEAKRNLKPMTDAVQKQIRAKAKTKDEAIKMAEDMGYDPYK